MTMQEDGKNYGDFLLDTIEGAKDQFTDEELTLPQVTPPRRSATLKTS